MTKTVPIAEAKATLSRWIRTVEQGEPVVITRHGRPVAALVPAEDVERLERLRAAGPEAGLVGLAGGWEGTDELVRRIEELARRGRRSVAPLD